MKFLIEVNSYVVIIILLTDKSFFFATDSEKYKEC